MKVGDYVRYIGPHKGVSLYGTIEIETNETFTIRVDKDNSTGWPYPTAVDSKNEWELASVPDRIGDTIKDASDYYRALQEYTP